MSRQEELVRRAQAYANRKGRALGKQLGSGVHGIVFAVEKKKGHRCSVEKPMFGLCALASLREISRK